MATPAPARIVERTDKPESCPITTENYAYLQKHVYAQSGIVLDSDKHYLLESRLIPIVRQERLASLNDLCARMRAEAVPTLSKQVVEAMTTNETLFFRDVAPFQALRTQVIPELQKLRADSKRLRFWSAASSSGQEAYSLAMMLLEMGLGAWNIEILGTDLSEQILERARQGKYMQLEVNRGLPAPCLVKYFAREGQQWQLKDEVRRMARFQRFDLRQSMAGLGVFDVVLCRNVLIYFDVETKKKILGEIRKSLVSGGYLVLGGAETTINLDDKYQRTPVGPAILYRVP
ncbi:MAG: protein-glutamate O-methyltransferase CheR [Terriglobales bacterium]|jgi:chemotaxis protein methyltransferase CheR